MNSAINEVYGSLLMETRPHVIRDDDDNERCIIFLETLLSKGHLSPEEEELADIISLLIENYERQFVIEPGATQADIVRHLMEANDLKPADMLDIFGTKSMVSMVLSGDRPLSKTHIKRLCERFHIPPDVFFLRSKAASTRHAVENLQG